VMTLPYGGSPYGLGQQQIDDANRHGIELLKFLEYKWASYLGRKVFDICKVYMERPMQLLKVFELAGKSVEAEGKFLSWNVPITGFPVVQHYTQGVPKKIWVKYGPDTDYNPSTRRYRSELQLIVCIMEQQVPKRGKQGQGAAPNIIHSLDAAHLMMTIEKSDFQVTTVHDSFGCLAPDMDALYDNVREAFVELYSSDPLSSIAEQIGADLSAVKIGTLDINRVLESEYCFS